MTYDTIVFDNDGVLVRLSGTQVLRKALQQTLEEFGVADPSEETLAQFNNVATVTVETLESFCVEHDLDSTTFWKRRQHNAATAQIEAVRNGEKTLYEDFDALESLGANLGIVSNNQQATVDGIVDYYDIGDLFDTTYGIEPSLDGIRRKKPSPYYLELALEDIGGERALYVGDSNVDLEAASRAGVDSAFIRRPHRETYQLEHEPTHEIESLTDLNALL